MPDPDARITNRDLTDKIVTSRLLDDDLTTSTFTATGRFTGDYETSVAAADTQRISLTSGVLRGFTGDAAASAPGIIEAKVSGSGDSRTLQTNIWAPSFLDNEGGVAVGEGGVFIVIRSASFDDSTSPPGVVFGYNGASTQTGVIQLQNNIALSLLSGSDLTLSTGSELTIPAVTSDPSSPADGNMWLHTVDNKLYIWEGGSRRTVASW